HRAFKTQNSSLKTLSPRSLPHVTVLVLLPAATRTRIIPPHPFAAVPDRFRLLVAALAVGDGGVLLAADVVGAGGVARRRFVDGGADLPERFLEAFLFLHAEDRIGDL